MSLWIGVSEQDFKCCMTQDMNNWPDWPQPVAWWHVVQLFAMVTQVSIMLWKFKESHRTSDWFKGHSHDYRWFDCPLNNYFLAAIAALEHGPQVFPLCCKRKLITDSDWGQDCNKTVQNSIILNMKKASALSDDTDCNTRICVRIFYFFGGGLFALKWENKNTHS